MSDTVFDLVAAGDESALATRLSEEPSAAGARNAEGVGTVLWALYHRRDDLARLLVESGAPVGAFEHAALGDATALEAALAADPSLARARTPDGFTALGLAAFFARAACVRVLLAAGADPDAASDNAMRVAPVHSAAAARSAECLRLLLDAGADPNAEQQGGYTPLMAAEMHGDAELVELLRAAGARR